MSIFPLVRKRCLRKLLRQNGASQSPGWHVHVVSYIGTMVNIMKINGKLQMNFGPVGHKMLVDNYSNTTIKINGIEPFEADSEGSDCFDKAGDWITPEFKIAQEFSLSIPSGFFSGRVTSVERRMEDQDAINGAAALGQVREHEAQEMQIVTVDGQWDGKQGGINSYADGGLCGLGTFFLSEVSSVEGTFGKASSLAEYNSRADRYRRLHYSVSTDEKTGAIQYSLTPKGETQLRRYLGQFTLDVEDVGRHSPYDWGTTPIQFALSQVRWEREHNQFTSNGLEGWVNLSFSEIPCVERRVDFRSFRQWLDLQFPKLNDQLQRQEDRTRVNPTERNLRRLARYQAAFQAQ